MQPARLRDIQLTRFLANLLGAYLEQHRAGQVVEGRFPLRPGQAAPDLFPAIQVFVTDHSRLVPTHAQGSADLAVHLVGPAETEPETDRLTAAYAGAGVSELWVIAGDRRQARFLRLTSDGTYEDVALADPPLYRSTVLPGFYLPIDLLWRDPLPSLRQTLELVLWMVTEDPAGTGDRGPADPAG